MKNEVDVLIIGSGASGAAVAWSLAETKMHILCLEQGDWMRQSDYPSNGTRLRDTLVQRLCDQPEHPPAAEQLPNQRRQFPHHRGGFQRLGGSTLLYTAHYPRLHPSEFGIRSLDDVADDWPIEYATLEPRQMDRHGPPLCLWSQEFYETDRSHGFVRGFDFQFVRTASVGNQAVPADANGVLPWR